MFKDQVISEGYEIDRHGIIQSPGKFEGEHYSSLKFYEIIMEGFAEEFSFNEGEPVYCAIQIDDELRKEIPELTEYGVVCYESDQGFFNTTFYETKEDYEAELANFEKQQGELDGEED